MAKLETEVKICVEAALHTGLRKVFIDLYEEHGVMVKQVEVDWHQPIMGGARRVLGDITIKTRSVKQ